jgi:hypothetical protein
VSKNKDLESKGMEMAGQKRFTVTWVSYLLLVMSVFLLSLGALPLRQFSLVPGLILGGVFPFTSLLYFYRHYVLGVGSLKGPFQKISNWLLPAFFVHIIVIFGFCATLNLSPGRKGDPPSSIYTTFYDYGRIFKSFREVLKPVDQDFVGRLKKEGLPKTELEKVIGYYSPYFPTIKKKQDETAEHRLSALAIQINQMPFLIALSFGFLGALIFCLRDAIRRFNAKDLYPKTYVFYLVRFIVSATLSVTIAYYVMDDWPVAFVPLVFFIIGYFPERVITYLDEKANKLFGIKARRYKEIPLSMIQGISHYKVLRLREIGVADAQNLALADIDHLEANLPFRRQLMCDWIAQSMLLLHFPDKIERLRGFGVRTILDFEQCFEGKANKALTDFAQKTNLEVSQMRLVLSILRSASVQPRLKRLADCLMQGS